MKPATPLPWTSELSEDDRMNATVEIKGAGGEWVASLPANGEHLKTAVKDGEYMVHVANMHQELVETLHGLVREIDFLIEDGTLPSDAASHPSCTNARAALAKAQGIPS